MIQETPISNIYFSKKRRFISRCPCVLVCKSGIVPLQKIKYDVAINGGLANVSLTQEYISYENGPVDVTYKFPINDKVVFGGMEAIFRNRRVKGKLKEKTQAKIEYEYNKAVGNTVAYAEQKSDTEDIMEVKLGNLLPNEPLSIVFSYHMRLDIVNEYQWGFRIPVQLTPRYNPGTGTTNVSYDQFYGGYSKNLSI